MMPATVTPWAMQQGGQGKYSHVSLLLILLPTNDANENEPLSSLPMKILLMHSFSIQFSGRESAVNRGLDVSSTYPS
jgi:hypothetical protein